MCWNQTNQTLGKCGQLRREMADPPGGAVAAPWRHLPEHMLTMLTVSSIFSVFSVLHHSGLQTTDTNHKSVRTEDCWGRRLTGTPTGVQSGPERSWSTPEGRWANEGEEHQDAEDVSVSVSSAWPSTDVSTVWRLPSFTTKLIQISCFSFWFGTTWCFPPNNYSKTLW